MLDTVMVAIMAGGCAVATFLLVRGIVQMLRTGKYVSPWGRTVTGTELYVYAGWLVLLTLFVVSFAVCLVLAAALR